MKNAQYSSHPMKAICDQWIAKIDLALKDRHERFGKYAEEAMNFFHGNHDWMWDDKYACGPSGFLDREGALKPTFRISVNKLFEAVALFGPALYHQNPNILVTPLINPEVSPEALGIMPYDQMGLATYQQMAMADQYMWEKKKACASVKQRYLNWIQGENDKKTHMRRAVTEALVAGIGYLETDYAQEPGSKIGMPVSRYLSWWDVVVDPDAKYWEDVQWIAIRRHRAVNLTERRYGLEKGDLKGNAQSRMSQSTRRSRKEARDNRGGKSYDLIEYWEVYSKNGFGQRLLDDVALQNLGGVGSEDMYDAFGDYCHIVVSRNVPFPLNIPTSSIGEETPEQLFMRAQWPIPFWYDKNGWPISRLSFYEQPNEVWPISLFRPAIGELRFVNWCLSFLADKVASSCHTYIGMMKDAAVNIQKQITGSSSPYTVLEISNATGRKVSEVIEIINAPDFQQHIWVMVREVLELIDKRTGLTELIYGMTRSQIRSAAEAQIKEGNTSVRPDDMAARVEEAATECAVREMQAARWMNQPEDVAPILGQLGTAVWANYIMTDDVDSVVLDYDYRVEAGTARKPNKQNKIAQLNEFGQYSIQYFQQMAMEGNPGPWNAYVTDWCSANDLDPSGYIIQPPDPANTPPSPEEVQAQVKMAELQMKMQEKTMEMDLDQQSHEQEMEQAKEMHELELELKKEEMKLKEKESKAKAQAMKIAAKNKPQPAKPKDKK